MKTRILFLAMLAVAVTSCGEKKTPEHTHEFSCSTVKEATCTEDGKSECTCKICGEKKSKTLPAEGHIPSEGTCVLKTFSCNEGGIEDCTCSVCGEEFEHNIPAGHTYVDGVCIRCEAYQYPPMVVSSNAVTVREQPSVSSARVVGLKKGDVVTVIEIEENGESVDGVTKWVKTVIYGNEKIYGWISAKYLEEPKG